MFEYQYGVDRNCEIYELNKNTFDNAIEIIRKTGSTRGLGQYQLDTLLNGIINQYDKENIKESAGNEIMSSALYANFISWLKMKNSNIELIEYISCVKFVQVFGKNHSHGRNSKGKCWLDIKIISNFDKINENSASQLMLYIASFPAVSNVTNVSKIDVNFDNYLEKYNVQKWYSIENFTFIDDKFIWKLPCNTVTDYYKPIKLVIKYNGEYGNILKNFDEFYIKINKTTILSQPMCKYITSSVVEMCNEEYKYELIATIANFPFLRKLWMDDTQLMITSRFFKESDIQISILVEHLICDVNVRNKLAMVPQIMNLCEKYQCDKISRNMLIDLYEGETKKNEYVRGILLTGSFAECFADNIQNLIRKINLKINNCVAISLDKNLIKLTGHFIDKFTLYIPIGDMNCDNIHNRISYKNMDSFELEIEFNEVSENSKLTVYVDMFEFVSYIGQEINGTNSKDYIKILSGNVCW